MWVSVRTRKISISPRMRMAIEKKVGLIFSRDNEKIASVVVYLTTVRTGQDDFEYAARMVLWSSAFGRIAVNRTGSTLRSAVGQAARRARHVVRERAKRKTDYSRLARHFVAPDEPLSKPSASAR